MPFRQVWVVGPRVVALVTLTVSTWLWQCLPTRSEAISTLCATFTKALVLVVIETQFTMAFLLSNKPLCCAIFAHNACNLQPIVRRWAFYILP